jgi:hypothetical protein
MLEKGLLGVRELGTRNIPEWSIVLGDLKAENGGSLLLIYLRLGAMECFAL